MLGLVGLTPNRAFPFGTSFQTLLLGTVHRLDPVTLRRCHSWESSHAKILSLERMDFTVQSLREQAQLLL